MKKYLIVLLMVALTVSCESEIEPAFVDSGELFFPLKTGDVKFYSVEETNYKIDGSIEELSYKIKEAVVESFFSDLDSTFVIYRYKREYDSLEWEFLETWQARSTDHQAILFEGNTPFLKLTFPISAGKTWDGNLLNSHEEDLYQMDSLYSEFNSANHYDSTLTVIQNDNQDFIVELDRRYEIYAYKIGLVYKEEIVYTYCTDDNCLGQQIIETGKKIKETLIEYEL